jgi:flagellin
MAIVINTNIGLEHSAQFLNKSSLNQSASMERLTTGLRVNHASDAAAEQIVIISMTTQARGSEQAIRNANDAVGLIQAADSAAEEVVTILQRQRELAIQSLNGTYNTENRSQMNVEFKQLSTEINRVAFSTKFNSLPIMTNNTNNSNSVSNTINNTYTMQIGWKAGNVGSGRDRVVVSISDFGIGGASSEIFGKFIFTASNGSKTSIATATSGNYSIASIGTVVAASQAVMKIDSALSNTGTQRVKWGALQNRLAYTTSSLNNTKENIVSAQDRLQAVDYAKEAATLARAQVLQQTTMLVF